jgi:hypothetical protein
MVAQAVEELSRATCVMKVRPPTLRHISRRSHIASRLDEAIQEGGADELGASRDDNMHQTASVSGPLLQIDRPATTRSAAYPPTPGQHNVQRGVAIRDLDVLEALTARASAMRLMCCDLGGSPDRSLVGRQSSQPTQHIAPNRLDFLAPDYPEDEQGGHET